MTDLHLYRGGRTPPDEPRRDPRLSALLRDLMGPVPVGDVDWDALAGRVGAAIRARQTPWWTYVQRWQRRALPLSLAAGAFGASILVHSWLTHPETLSSAPDMVSAVVAGTPTEHAATIFAHAVTSATPFAADFPE
jgi:hypothetical protein